MPKQTNTRSSILVFAVILSFGLFSIIFTFNNEGWKFSDNIHIRSIMVIIAVWILALIKFILLIKEHQMNKDYDHYVVLPISFIIGIGVLGLYMLIYYPFSLSKEWGMGILNLSMCIGYTLIYAFGNKSDAKENKIAMMLISLALLILTIIISVYLLLGYPFVPYTVETDLGSFYVVIALGLAIYLGDYLIEEKSLEVIKYNENGKMVFFFK